MRALSTISAGFLVLAIAVMSSSAYAQSSSGPGWVDVVKEKVVQHICQDGGKWVECYDQRPSECQRIARSFAYPCIDKAARTAPREVDNEIATEISKSMVECFNTNFQTNYGAWQKRTPECRQPPKHLQ